MPFGVIYILNWVLFITIFVSLCRKKDIKSTLGADKKGEIRRKLKQQFIIALTLSLLFGLGWGVGFAATTSISVLSVSTILQSIFIILTSFQGLLIFIMQCFRSEDARKEWSRWAQVITCNKVNLDKKKKKKYNVQSATSKGGMISSNPYGTLSTSVDPNSETLRKAVRNDLMESSTFEESTFGASTFVSTAMEPIEEEKRDLSLDKEEKGKYELLSRSESGKSPPQEENETTALDMTLEMPSTFAPAPLVVDDASTPLVTADGSLLPEVPISPTAREVMELALLDPAATKPDRKETGFPTEYDIVMVNENTAEPDTVAATGSEAHKVIQMVDDILNETTTFTTN